MLVAAGHCYNRLASLLVDAIAYLTPLHGQQELVLSCRSRHPNQVQQNSQDRRYLAQAREETAWHSNRRDVILVVAHAKF